VASHARNQRRFDFVYIRNASKLGDGLSYRMVVAVVRVEVA
jgi:hypothetical protein